MMPNGVCLNICALVGVRPLSAKDGIYSSDVVIKICKSRLAVNVLCC